MSALDEVLVELRCPNCASGLARSDGVLRCGSGHSFDIARDGHVSLLTGRHELPGDTTAMVADRTLVLESGAFESLTAAIVAAATPRASTAPAVAVDIAGGTGLHLAAVLSADPELRGIVVESSTAALHVAARSHPRIAAVGADVTRPLPIRDRVAGVILSSFGPRPGAELARILHPDGVLVVASPGPGHLAELQALSDVAIDPRKQDRLDHGLPGFAAEATDDIRALISADRELQLALIGMGPSAFHSSADERRARANDLPDRLDVTLAFRVTSYRPRESR